MDLVVEAVKCHRSQQSLQTTAMTLWMLDFAQTFPIEVEHIWPSPPGLVKTLYFLNRYQCIDLVAAFVLSNVPNPKVCHVAFICISAFSFIGIAVSEAIMFVRLFALAGRKRPFGYALSAQFAVIHAASIAILGYLISQLSFIPSILAPVIPCMPVKSSSLPVTIFFGMIMANELVIVLITIYIGIKKYRRSRSPLIQLCYRDGVFYFVAVAATSIANIIIIRLSPEACKYMFIVPQRVVNSLLAGRTILHIREQSLRHGLSQRTPKITSKERNVGGGSTATSQVKFESVYPERGLSLTARKDVEVGSNISRGSLAVYVQTHTMIERDSDDGFGDVVVPMSPRRLEPLRRAVLE